MQDFTMCEGGSCRKKLSCYRFIAEKNSEPMYFKKIPMKSNGFCTEFLEAKKELYPLLSKEKTDSVAYDLSTRSFDFNSCIWLLAEIKIMMERLIKGEYVEEFLVRIPKDPKIAIETFLQNPNPEEIQMKAHSLANNQSMTLQDLHWRIAEETLLYTLFKIRIFEALKWLAGKK
jgi:hypothetical protein